MVLERTKLFEKYQNKWVALTPEDKVISDGNTLAEVLKKAVKKGYKEPVVIKIPDLKYDYLL